MPGAVSQGGGFRWGPGVPPVTWVEHGAGELLDLGWQGHLIVGGGAGLALAGVQQRPAVTPAGREAGCVNAVAAAGRPGAGVGPRAVSAAAVGPVLVVLVGFRRPSMG
jgi:hypothetical protein